MAHSMIQGSVKLDDRMKAISNDKRRLSCRKCQMIQNQKSKVRTKSLNRYFKKMGSVVKIEYDNAVHYIIKSRAVRKIY